MKVELRNPVLSKIAWRILPFLLLLGVLNYLDRANIAFAALEMNKDLGFGPAVYGFGAGVFFLSYCVLEVPSNLILVRVGVRRWMARIMITWGVIAMATAWINGETSFYVMRFLLGAAEAGFLPAIMYYLRQWFPGQSRGKLLAVYMSNTAIANIVGGPLAAWLMTTFSGAFGLHGWQMLFILEGLPSVIVGVLVLYWMTERPDAARWLTPAEKQWLRDALQSELSAQGSRAATSLRQGFLDSRVLLITALCFFLIVGNFGVVFWLPQIVKGLGNLSINQVGLLTAIPYLLACAAMIAWGAHSDRTGDRKWHLVIGALVGAAGLVESALVTEPVAAFIGLCVAAIGIWSMFGVFWALPSDFLSGRAAAGGMALINSVGTFGGFCGPYIFGFVRERTGNFSDSLLVLAGSIAICAVIASLLRNEWRRESVLPGLVPGVLPGRS
jgi:MFS transporter, ACS family, tartrate transporter